MAILAATNKQLPENSILDANNKQIYLGNQYSASASFSVSTSEINLLLLQNLQTGNAGNFKSLFQNILKVSETTASQSILLNIYLNPTITGNGTTVVPVNMRFSYGNNSIATITKNPTTSSNGTLLDVLSAAALSASMSNLLKILDEGQSLLITGTASNAATAINVILQWYEL